MCSTSRGRDCEEEEGIFQVVEVCAPSPYIYLSSECLQVGNGTINAVVGITFVPRPPLTEKEPSDVGHGAGHLALRGAGAGAVAGLVQEGLGEALGGRKDGNMGTLFYLLKKESLCIIPKHENGRSNFTSNVTYSVQSSCIVFRFLTRLGLLKSNMYWRPIW